MGLRHESRVIDGLEVTTAQLPVMRASALMARLGRVFTPALTKIGSLADLTLSDDVSALAPALMALFEQLDGGEAQALIRESLAGTSVIQDGKQIPLSSEEAINLVFTGRLRTMLLVMKFALEVNYADFFDVGALAKLKGRGAPAATKEASPST